MSNQYPKTAHTRGTTFTRLGLSTLPAGTWSIAAKVYTGAGVRLIRARCMPHSRRYENRS